MHIREHLEGARNVTIIGGGAIGLEVADNALRINPTVRVRIIEKATHVLPAVDLEIACLLQEYLRKEERLELVVNAQVDELVVQGDVITGAQWFCVRLIAMA